MSNNAPEDSSISVGGRNSGGGVFDALDANCCLSPLVRSLILMKPAAPALVLEDSNEFFSIDGRLVWENWSLDRLTSTTNLGPFPPFFDTLSDPEAFITCMHIQKAACEAEKKMKNVGIGDLQQTFPNSFRIRFGAALSRLHLEYERTGDAMLCFAALCTVVESTLGDVFATVESKRQPVEKLRQKAPPLLKNLLGTKELKDGIGEEAVFILQAIIGSPRHLNLRNVIWHGFSVASEIHCGYYWTLLLLFLDVMDRAFVSGVLSTTPIVHNRDVLRDLSQYTPDSHDFGLGPMAFLFDYKRNELDELEASQRALHEQLLGFAQNTPFVFAGRDRSIEQALYYFSRSEVDPYASWFSLLHLLPAMEHCLRVVWVDSNSLPSALLCADSFRYYTIMDMFMEPRVLDETMTVEALTTTEPSSHPPTPVPGSVRAHGSTNIVTIPSSNPKHSKSTPISSTARPNALIDVFGVPILTALNDTFLFPYGPRPRDRIAHGDVDPTSIPRCTTARCLELFFALALRFAQHKNMPLSPSEQEDSLAAEWRKKCLAYFDGFISCWHPHSLLQKLLRDSARTAWHSWQQSIFSLSVRNSTENESDRIEVDDGGMELLRRNGCPDDSLALEEVESLLVLRISSATPASSLIRSSFEFDEECLIRAVIVPDRTALSQHLKSVPVFDRESQFSSYLESARNLAQEAQITLSSWLSRFLAQKEQIETRKATSRLQASVYKLLGILNYVSSYFSIVFRIAELSIHDHTLHQQSMRKLTTLIIRLAQLVKSNSWEESLALMNSGLPLMLKILSI